MAPLPTSPSIIVPELHQTLFSSRDVVRATLPEDRPVPRVHAVNFVRWKACCVRCWQRHTGCEVGCLKDPSKIHRIIEPSIKINKGQPPYNYSTIPSPSPHTQLVSCVGFLHRILERYREKRSCTSHGLVLFSRVGDSKPGDTDRFITSTYLVTSRAGSPGSRELEGSGL